MGRRAGYRAYLLRLWRVQAGPEPTWRASLEDAHSGVSLVFPSLERACAFLADQLAEPGDAGRARPPEDGQPRAQGEG